MLLGTAIASVGTGDLDKLMAFVALRLVHDTVHLTLFLPFPDVSTEGADKYLGFIAYGMSN